MHIGILGSPQGPYVRELVATATNRGHVVSVLSFAELSVHLINHRVEVYSRPGDVQLDCADPYRADPYRAQLDRVQSADAHQRITAGVRLTQLDALLVRTMPLGSLEQVIFRMDALQAVERAGVPVVNPPRTLEVAIDKWLTLERLAAQQLPTPPTIACQSRDAALAAFEQLGGDVVVKPLFGGEGRGLLRINDKDLAWRVFSTLAQLGNVLYVQQFIPHFGYDIRVLKIGQQLFSVKRWAAPGQWRTNVSQGSRAEAHQLTDQQRELTLRAAETITGSVLGLDILPTRDGANLLLEVNAVPGWRGTASALALDIGQQIIEHLEQLHAQRS